MGHFYYVDEMSFDQMVFYPKDILFTQSLYDTAITWTFGTVSMGHFNVLMKCLLAKCFLIPKTLHIHNVYMAQLKLGHFNSVDGYF